MSWFQLDSDSVVERARAAARPVEVPSLGASLRRGIVGFTLLSVAGFTPWAVAGRWLSRHLGEAGFYCVCAVVFIGLSGLLLHRLILGPGSLGRFYKLFGLAFSANAVGWMAGWMSLWGNTGSLVGLLAGTTAMGWILALAFDAKRAAPAAIAALFVLNTAGYFAGGWIEGAFLATNHLPLLGDSLSKAGQFVVVKLIWGLCYGAGFGAGLGIAFHLCQSQTRAKLLELEREQTS